VLELYHPSYYPNMFGLISTVLLSIMTVSLAFTNRGLTVRILKGNDISYGIYIYHMPIINIFVHQKKNIIYPLPPHGSIYGIGMLFLVFVIVVCLAYISWVCVEKKALALKTR
jgi:peptidoglycan/LPS O-acetylase OafA/YrhL